MFRKFYLGVILMSGCMDYLPTEKNLPQSSLDPNSPAAISICYNLESDLHGSECSEDCFVSGKDTTFCWVLYKDDCNLPLNHEWQEKNCHFFN
jgi:hypothetical protein